MKVDYLPADVTGVPGAFGLTHAPGLHGALAEDLDDLHAGHPDLVLISLVGEAELVILGIEDLVARSSERGIELVRFPIADHSVPDAISDLVPLVERILAAAQAERAVILHCWAGRGRSGMVAAACLAALGFTPEEAIATLRRHRLGAVEDVDQEEAVGAFALLWHAREQG